MDCAGCKKNVNMRLGQFCLDYFNAGPVTKNYLCWDDSEEAPDAPAQREAVTAAAAAELFAEDEMGVNDDAFLVAVRDSDTHVVAVYEVVRVVEYEARRRMPEREADHAKGDEP